MAETYSAYHRGASDGFIMGAYLSAMFLCQAIGFKVTYLLLVGDIMMLGVPVIAYILLRRTYVAQEGRPTFSALWMQGILIFLCGSLIMALVMYIYMRFINPTFISDQFILVEQMLNEANTPDTLAMADIVHRMIDEHMLPSPISMSISSIWFCGFSGAILSMLLSAIARAFKITPAAR